MAIEESRDAWVLQLCHGYDGPFLDCARQYAAALESTDLKVCTVYLTGERSSEVERASVSDEVVFMEFSGRDLRGLKLQAIRRIRRLIASRDFVVCIAHRFKPTHVALFASSLPVLAVNHAFGVYRRPMRRLLANFFKSRLTLLGVSQSVRDDLRSCLPGWPVEKVQHLYNRIDPEMLRSQLESRDQARILLGLPADAWVVGNVGRLHPDKDQCTLIRGFARALPALPANSLLVVLGRGRLEKALRALAAELGIADKVLFLGQVPHARRLFTAFDAFALSSDHEPFGMVLLEAMVAGVPLIATDAGGASEVVGGIGQLFALGDQNQLATCLKRAAAMGEDEIVAAQQAMWERLHERFSDAIVGPELLRLVENARRSSVDEAAR